ncbi:hypothetical protein ACLOJK_008871 [Asimina triloba]
MDDTQSVATLIESTTSKIQQLQQAFSKLESQRAVSLNLKWKELEEHFHDLERSLKKKFDELEDQKKAYETKASEAQEMLDKREAGVVAKEQALLKQLQEKRNNALSAVGNVYQKYKEAANEPTSGVENSNADASAEDKSDITTVKINAPDSQPGKSSILDVKFRTQLIKLCKEMDAEGLHKFISDNRKNLAGIREEIPLALKSAPEPAYLVLNSLEDFYHAEVPSLDGKKDSSLLGLRRTCLMLLESLGMLLTSSGSESISDNQMISSDIREQAKRTADAWKPKLDNLNPDASSGNSLEAHAFLQLIATFGIVSEFDQDDICKLIPSVSRRRQTADLCCSLGLSKKMPGVIEVLVKIGRQMEVVNLAYAFELTEQFPPVPLLKAYLDDAKKASLVNGNTSPAAQNEANERELSALRAVIKCIGEHQLEDQYPIDPLQKQVIQLEKAKVDKKRAAEAAKPQPKRPRANINGYGSRVTGIPENFHRGPPERYPYIYDRPYMYASDSHGPLSVRPPSCNLLPNHGPYFGNGYQYPTPYLR